MRKKNKRIKICGKKDKKNSSKNREGTHRVSIHIRMDGIFNNNKDTKKKNTNNTEIDLHFPLIASGKVIFFR